MKPEPITPAEAKALLGALEKTWIPGAYEEFLSGVEKLQRIARSQPTQEEKR
jgi:hypothetical protein